jgi:putative ABC transport system permease protein
MLKYLPLVWSNLKRRRLRLLFTLASIAVAFLLYGLLEALRYAFGMGVDLAGADRLMVVHKTSIIQPLPAAYGNRIRGLKGVKRVSSSTWLGGMYQNERNQVVTFPVDGESYFAMYPEILVPEDQMRAWLADRGGAIIGIGLAQQYGWKLGDVVPIRSEFWRKADGSDTWELRIDGIYTVKDGAGDTRTVFMHYDYFNEARGPGSKDLVGWYVLQVEDPQAAPQIAREIDEMFANSSYETRASTEKAFAQQFANQVGNVGAILIAVAAAVFFTMLLVTANTMAQAVRERTSEIGVLKTLGFTDVTVMLLVLFESLVITVLGGLIGLLAAMGVIAGARVAVEQFLPLFRIPDASIVIAAGLMLGLGLLAGALPAAQALRLRIVAALRAS